MFDRMIVPLDGSDFAEAAVAYAKLIPARQIRVVHVQPAPDELVERTTRHSSSSTTTMVQDYLSRATEPLARDGRIVELTVLNGDPAEQIIGAAMDANLIVMTTRGRGAGGRLISGSVADRVARHAPVPTLIVRNGARPIAAAPIQRIVVPLDGSIVAERALPTAATLAIELTVPVALVTVAETDVAPAEGPDDTPGRPQKVSPQGAQKRAETDLSSPATHLRQADLSVTTEVRRGQPVVELMAVIQPGDLIVMTTHGGGGGQRWHIGGVAEKLLRQAPAPILLVRGDAEAGVIALVSADVEPV